MNKARGILIGLVLATPSVAIAVPESWAFVLSVGGITVGEPVQADGVWTLPVQADVSGLAASTSKPTTLNSALVCSSVVAKIIDDAIYLTINTDLPGAAKSARCPAARLGVVKSGTYSILYKGPQDAPVLLRSVHVGL
jgi:hypothetical protein